MSIRAFSLLIVAVAALLLANGCGSDGSAGATAEGGAAGSLADSQWVKQANTLCTDAGTQVHEEFDRFSRNDNKTSLPEFFDILAAIYGDLINQIRSLEPPDGHKQEAAEFPDALEKRLEYLQHHLGVFANSRYPFGEVLKAARKNDLPRCASVFP